jgi:hypothetical protein
MYLTVKNILYLPILVYVSHYKACTLPSHPGLMYHTVESEDWRRLDGLIVWILHIVEINPLWTNLNILSGLPTKDSRVFKKVALIETFFLG